MASVIALIPARSGSKGVPNKNIRELGGRPLIEWSIAACLASRAIDRVIVSTDSEDYAHLARSMGAEAPFLRPLEISGDYSTDFDFIQHALNWFSINESVPEYIAHIRPTTPFRIPRLIDEAIEMFIKNPHATALRSVHQMSESSYKTFEIAPGGQLKAIGALNTKLDFSNNARQLFPATYMANGYVDVLSTDFIQENQLIHGDFVLPYITPLVQEIDTVDDFYKCEFELQKNPQIAAKIFIES